MLLSIAATAAGFLPIYGGMGGPSINNPVGFHRVVPGLKVWVA
jgi:hypothetical protein